MLLTAEVQYEIEQFLYVEAALLDEHRYNEWLELFAEDCHYWMPVRQIRLAQQVDEEFTRPGEIAYFDDNKQSLASRVKKLLSPLAWSESPPPRTRHMYSNIRPIAVDGTEITVSGSFTFYRCAFENDVDWLLGRREDVLRRTDDGGFKIVRRSIFLDQTVIVAKNMNHFF